MSKDLQLVDHESLKAYRIIAQQEATIARLTEELSERRVQPLLCAMWRPGTEAACGDCEPCRMRRALLPAAPKAGP